VSETTCPSARESAGALHDRSSASSRAVTGAVRVQSVARVSVSEYQQEASAVYDNLCQAPLSPTAFGRHHVATAYMGWCCPLCFCWAPVLGNGLGADSLEVILASAPSQRIRRYYATLLTEADNFFRNLTDQTAVNRAA
jgi:hypothetical protein